MKITVVTTRKNAKFDVQPSGVLTDHVMESGGIIVKIAFDGQEIHIVEDRDGIRAYAVDGRLNVEPVAANVVKLKEVKP